MNDKNHDELKNQVKNGQIKCDKMRKMDKTCICRLPSDQYFY